MESTKKFEAKFFKPGGQLLVYSKYLTHIDDNNWRYDTGEDSINYLFQSICRCEGEDGSVDFYQVNGISKAFHMTESYYILELDPYDIGDQIFE